MFIFRFKFWKQTYSFSFLLPHFIQNFRNLWLFNIDFRWDNFLVKLSTCKFNAVKTFREGSTDSAKNMPMILMLLFFDRIHLVYFSILLTNTRWSLVYEGCALGLVFFCQFSYVAISKREYLKQWMFWGFILFWNFYIIGKCRI